MCTASPLCDRSRHVEQVQGVGSARSACMRCAQRVPRRPSRCLELITSGLVSAIGPTGREELERSPVRLVLLKKWQLRAHSHGRSSSGSRPQGQIGGSGSRGRDLALELRAWAAK